MRASEDWRHEWWKYLVREHEALKFLEEIIKGSVESPGTKVELAVWVERRLHLITEALTELEQS